MFLPLAGIQSSGFFPYGATVGIPYGANYIANVNTTSKTFPWTGSAVPDHDVSRSMPSSEIDVKKDPASQAIDIATKDARRFLFSNIAQSGKSKKSEKLESKFSSGCAAACTSINNKAILIRELYLDADTVKKKNEICSIARELCVFIDKHDLSQSSAFVLWTNSNDGDVLEKITKRILEKIPDGNGGNSVFQFLENVFKRNLPLRTGGTGKSDALTSDDWCVFNKKRDWIVSFVGQCKDLRAPRENAIVTGWSRIFSLIATEETIKETGQKLGVENALINGGQSDPLMPTGVSEFPCSRRVNN
jgi:hypothetical protein